MATADWENFKFEGVDHVDLQLMVIPGVIFSDCTVGFDMTSKSSESFGIRFMDTGQGKFYDVVDSRVASDPKLLTFAIQEIAEHFECLTHCEMKMTRSTDIAGVSASFDLKFDDEQTISFYNDHGGHYSHDFWIEKDGVTVFRSSL